jgi:hypothetical protein
MMLPYDALRHGTRRPLLLSHILFLVMGSTRYRARSELVQQSWCQRQKASCIFFTDDDLAGEGDRDEQPLTMGAAAALGDQITATPATDVGSSGRNWTSRRDAGGIPLVRVRDAIPPSHCFCNDSARQKSTSPTGFFCTSHRAATLEAQYRFLPVRRERSSKKMKRKSGAPHWLPPELRPVTAPSLPMAAAGRIVLWF